MISLSGLTFAYPGGVPVFSDFGLEIPAGQTWAVLGPSGCGKTTLLYLLAGLLLPTSGQVRIQGQAITRPRPKTGLILQDYGLLPWATVRQNASLGLDLRRFYGPDGLHTPGDLPPVSPGEVDSWLARLGLQDVAGKYPAQLSGGQRQRTAIARTLVLRPDLLLMDEPFSSLDAPTRESLQGLALELCQEQGLTLVVVTHTIEEAAVLGQRILLLNQPPNRAPRIVENEHTVSPSYRGSPEFSVACQRLRSLIAIQTTIPKGLQDP